MVKTWKPTDPLEAHSPAISPYMVNSQVNKRPYRRLLKNRSGKYFWSPSIGACMHPQTQHTHTPYRPTTLQFSRWPSAKEENKNKQTTEKAVHSPPWAIVWSNWDLTALVESAEWIVTEVSAARGRQSIDLVVLVLEGIALLWSLGDIPRDLTLPHLFNPFWIFNFAT